MAAFMNEDDDLDGAYVSTMISATTLLNLCAELSECCKKRKHNVSEFAYSYLWRTGTTLRSRRLLLMRSRCPSYNFPR